MAKNKPAAPRSDSTTPDNEHDVDETVNAEVLEASEQVQTAREQLRCAEALLETAREKAVEKVAQFKNKSAGELIDTSLDFVRKHPGLGVFTAASVGFLLGRLFRR